MTLPEAQNLIQEGILGVRLAGKLASYLKKTVSPNEAREILRNRLKKREKDFLELAKRGIYARPKNPNLKLLKHAGCTCRDLQGLVEKEGLEHALHVLFRQGVYLTSEEFSGKRETIRGSLRFTVKPEEVRNPLAKRHLPVRSSGSRSHGTQVIRDLSYVHDNTLSLILYLEARKSLHSEKAYWSVPGGVILSHFIKLTTAGTPPSRWFSQLDASAKEINFRYRLSARLLKLSGYLAGVSMPGPEYVSLEEPLPILLWIRDCLQRGTVPHLFTFSSSAVRLAQRALEAGIDLRGTHITVSGEPITSARLETIRQSNAEAFSSMGCVEAGSVGYGCLSPQAPDDMHLLKDLHAVIQPGEVAIDPDLRPQSLLFTSLRLSSALILLNVSIGDEAVLRQRVCGCPLGNLGLDTHLEFVRSTEKLTTCGMALLDTEFIRILEEALPSKFGGGPMDYQFLEDESEDGTPDLRLVIHPRVGPLDADEVKHAFLRMIGFGSGADKLTSLLWRDADVVTVERSIPRTTATGKIQHLHTTRRKRNTDP